MDNPRSVVQYLPLPILVCGTQLLFDALLSFVIETITKAVAYIIKTT